MSGRLVAGIAAAVVTVIGALLVLSYVRGIEASVAEGDEIVEVYVATRDVERGLAAEELGDAVARAGIPARYVAPNALTDLATVAGQRLTVDLVAGEQVLAQRFAADEDDVEADDAFEIPAGLHQFTLALEPQRVMGGRLAPGDTVGVFVSLTDKTSDEIGDSTHLILHKILVTAVQFDATDLTNASAEAELDSASRAPTNRILVTLAATASEAERVVFGAEHGSVWLSLEPADAAERGTAVRDRENIFP